MCSLSEFKHKRSVRNEPNCERGSAAIETAISLLVFLMLVIFAMWTSLGMYRWVSLQFVVASIARWAALGQPSTTNPTLSREHAIEERLYNAGQRYGLDFGQSHTSGVNHPNIRVCRMLAPNCPTDNAGSANEFIIVAAEQPWKIVFWNVTLRASALGQNEPTV